MSSTTETNLTTREQDMLIKAWQCMDTQPKIDTKQLASLCGYTEQSAATLWSKLKKKIAAAGVGGGDSTPGKKTPTSKKANKKRKLGEGADSGDELTTPTPKKKRGGPVKKKEESESGDEIKVEDFV